jgi:general stress protein 26
MSFSASDSPAMRLTDAAARVAMRLGDAELGAGVGQLDDDAPARRGPLPAPFLRLPYGEVMTFDPSDRAALAAFVREQAAGVIATVSPAGAPEAALVGIAALDGGTLIFDTAVDSRKIAQLRHESRIALVVGTGGDVSVQIEGVAEIAEGSSRDQYGAAYNAQFPGSRALEPDFAVVVVRPGWVRVYDASVHPASVAEARW